MPRTQNHIGNQGKGIITGISRKKQREAGNMERIQT